MATKKIVKEYLRNIHADAELDASFGDVWEAEINAPQGFHWCEGPHQLVESCPAGFISKDQFWSNVLDRLQGLEAVRCDDDDNPCEGVDGFGACEWWS